MDTGIALLASEARTATTASDDVRTTVGDGGALLTLDITKAPNTAETLTLQVEAKDEASGKYVPITAFAATKEARNSQPARPSPSRSTPQPQRRHRWELRRQASPIPRHWRAKITHSAAGSWTYSLGYQPLSA